MPKDESQQSNPKQAKTVSLQKLQQVKVQKSEEHEAREVPGQRRQDCCDEIERQGDHEPLLSTLTVGEVRKKQRADD